MKTGRLENRINLIILLIVVVGGGLMALFTYLGTYTNPLYFIPIIPLGLATAALLVWNPWYFPKDKEDN